MCVVCVEGVYVGDIKRVKAGKNELKDCLRIIK